MTEMLGHHWTFRGGRRIHLAACPCWSSTDVPTVAQVRGRFAAVTPGDTTVPRGRRWRFGR